ncbi:MAG: hypothetical protein MHMPM18_002751 [Marteilia pararefringens]
MLNAKLLTFVDERLRLATQRNEDFGGIKIILVGDPRQLPPINGAKLWDKIDQSSEGTLTAQNLRGLCLYKSFETMAYLSISQRHQGDNTFSSLVDRIGEAKLTEADYLTLEKNNM